MLTYNEKKTLSFLIIASILIIFYIILTSNNISIKNQKILIKNQRICIFHMNGNIKEDFIEKYQKNKHKLANIDIINLNVSPKSSNVGRARGESCQHCEIVFANMGLGLHNNRNVVI